jgi:CheY-like chemotaxis protein
MPKPLRVLLVEDSERDAALLRLYLRRGGYEAVVQRVDTRAELYAQLQGGPWDLVVSDFNLPGFDAFAVLEAVRESGRAVPVVVLSGDYTPAAIGGITAAGVRYAYKGDMAGIMAIIDEYTRKGA